MEKGSVVRIEYTGKDASNGKVFDTTEQTVAQQAGLVHDGHEYTPLTVVLGNGELLPALEKALMEMKEGEHKTIVLKPMEAFGERRADLVVVVPLQEFKKRNLQPFPGLSVELNERVGKVQSVSGGRVRVDFNNELAGKEIQYDLKIVNVLKTKEEKANAIAKKFFPFADEKTLHLQWNGKALHISLPTTHPEQRAVLKPWCAKALMHSIPEIEHVEFLESYDRKSVETQTQADMN